jgi:hypothetical protein
MPWNIGVDQVEFSVSRARAVNFTQNAELVTLQRVVVVDSDVEEIVRE